MSTAQMGQQGAAGSSRERVSRRVPARGARHAVVLKRAHEDQDPADGIRVLVDRLWPRGLSKERLAADYWLKDLAPSDALRRWYGHEPSRWKMFAARYRRELAQQTELLLMLDGLRRLGRVTLLYAARDPDHNNAVVLREVLKERRFAGTPARKKPQNTD